MAYSETRAALVDPHNDVSIEARARDDEELGLCVQLRIGDCEASSVMRMVMPLRHWQAWVAAVDGLLRSARTEEDE